MFWPTSLAREEVLKEYHDLALGGLAGFRRTNKTLAQDFYWVGIGKAVKNHDNNFAV